MSNSLRLCGLYPARLLCPWDFPGKNTGMGCHALLQRIFPTQGSDPHLSPALVGGFFITSSSWEVPFSLFILSRPSKDWVMPIHVTEGSVVKNLSASVEEASSIPGSGRSLGGGTPVEQPTPVFLPEESHGQRSLADYSPWDRKQLDTTE